MLERERLVADGAGVCAVAAVMQGLVPELRGKRYVIIVSYYNVFKYSSLHNIHLLLNYSERLLYFVQSGMCSERW